MFSAQPVSFEDIATDRQNDVPSETVILELSGNGRIFTALEPTSLFRNASYTCVATNYEVLWVDELSTGPPILTWRHDMGSGAIQNMHLQILNGPTSGECSLHTYIHTDDKNTLYLRRLIRR
jgi:hypothetical protein